MFPRNEQQVDAIICHECVFRAELVYVRYANMESRVGKEENMDPENTEESVSGYSN